MRRMTSCAMIGRRLRVEDHTASSPTTTPVFGSPSAVYAYAPPPSAANVIFLSSRSAWDANALLMILNSKSAGPGLTVPHIVHRRLIRRHPRNRGRAVRIVAAQAPFQRQGLWSDPAS